MLGGSLEEQAEVIAEFGSLEALLAEVLGHGGVFGELGFEDLALGLGSGGEGLGACGFAHGEHFAEGVDG